MGSLLLDQERGLIDLIVLFSVGSVGSLYISVEFRTSRWKDKELYTSFLACLFELGHELRTTVYLNEFSYLAVE